MGHNESPKLTLDEPISGLSFSVQADRFIFNRLSFYWSIRAGETELASGSDLQLSPLSNGAAAEALETLLSFVGAFAEALDYQQGTGRESDNAELFTPELAAAIQSVGFSSDDAAILAEQLKARGDE